MHFIAIDFETATAKRSSACAVGVVMVKNGEIYDTYHSLIQPPGNEYSWHNTNVHGLRSSDTMDAPSFLELYPTLKKIMAGQTIVAHNEVFDRSVMKNTMAFYGIDYGDLGIGEPWECTLKIYRAKGYKPASLDACCRRHGIELNHHEALSDARACAKLYLKTRKAPTLF